MSNNEKDELEKKQTILVVDDTVEAIILLSDILGDDFI